MYSRLSKQNPSWRQSHDGRSNQENHLKAEQAVRQHELHFSPLLYF